MSILTQVEQYRGRQKAISHRPDLAGRVHILTQTATGVQSELEAYTDYAKTYTVYPWVNRAISVIANAFAPLDVRVVDADGEAIDNHPLTLFFRGGNDRETPALLWQKYIVHKFLGGEAFMEIVDGRTSKTPVEYWFRRPDGVGVMPDESPERLLYPAVAAYSFGSRDNEITIPPESMWHDPFYNPLNQWRGIAPITAVRSSIVIDMLAMAQYRALLGRGATPELAIISSVGLTPSEREELRQSIMTKYGGSTNNGQPEPLILEDGVSDIRPLSLPPKDMEWLEQRRFSRDEIGAIFGVPDEIMGYGRDTYENFGTALKVLWVLTLKPIIDRRDTSLQHFFTRTRPMLKPGERIETDISNIGELQDDIAPKLEQASKLFSLGYAPNDINRTLSLGMPDVPWGDRGYLPSNLIPIDLGQTTVNDDGAMSTNSTLSLNGAQVASIVNVVNQVAAGLLPAESAAQILMLSFSLTRPQVDSILGPIKEGSLPPAEIVQNAVKLIEANIADPKKKATFGSLDSEARSTKRFGIDSTVSWSVTSNE